MTPVGPALPLSRVRALRTVVYAFVLVDVLLVSNDVLGYAGSAAYYRPLLLARLLHLPPVTAPMAWALLAATVGGCLLALAGRAPRAAGAVVGISFGLWMLYSNGYGYVAHDHLPLMVAVWVLPTVPAARWREDTPDEAAGWAILAIRLAVVATYALSVLSKVEYSGSPAAWANSAILAWAFLRRGSILAQWLLEVPWLLIPAQWAALAMEVLSPVVLFLRGRVLYAAIGVFLLFHLTTLLTLGIHFLPVVVCWAAFLPLERVRDTRLVRRLRQWPVLRSLPV